MAFAQQQVVTIPAANKATAFINIWVKKPDGTRAKLGALVLKDSTAYQAGVIDRLTKGGDEAIASLMKVLEIDFKLAATEAVKSDAVGF